MDKEALLNDMFASLVTEEGYDGLIKRIILELQAELVAINSAGDRTMARECKRQIALLEEF